MLSCSYRNQIDYVFRQITVRDCGTVGNAWSALRYPKHILQYKSLWAAVQLDTAAFPICARWSVSLAYISCLMDASLFSFLISCPQHIHIDTEEMNPLECCWRDLILIFYFGVLYFWKQILSNCWECGELCVTIVHKMLSSAWTIAFFHSAGPHLFS